jgi:hypothetical protein
MRYLTWNFYSYLKFGRVFKIVHISIQHVYKKLLFEFKNPGFISLVDLKSIFSAVGIATGYGLDSFRVTVRYEFSVLHIVKTGYGDRPTSPSNG